MKYLKASTWKISCERSVLLMRRAADVVLAEHPVIHMLGTSSQLLMWCAALRGYLRVLRKKGKLVHHLDQMLPPFVWPPRKGDLTELERL